MTKVGHGYHIDDDESMRISLSRMLRELGYLVEDYASASVFLEKSVPVSPVVILLDMQMPDLDWARFARKLPKAWSKVAYCLCQWTRPSPPNRSGFEEGGARFLI
jgi:FixJ family two-component response regulator